MAEESFEVGRAEGAGQGGGGVASDDEALFDLHVFLDLVGSVPQPLRLKLARELGILVTPKDLARGEQAVLARFARQALKPRVWPGVRDWLARSCAAEIARVAEARSPAVIDDLLREGRDWGGVYWLCLKAGKYHAAIPRRYGRPARAALDAVRARCRALIEEVEGARQAGEEARSRALEDLRRENERLTKLLRAAEARIERLKGELHEAGQALRAQKRAAWEAKREPERILAEATAEIGRLQARAEEAEASARRREAEAEALLQATIRDYEERFAALREVISQQDAEILELLAAVRRGGALPEAPAGSAATPAAALLRGRTVCVVGGETRLPGYREIVAAYGAEMTFASGLEKLGQIDGAVSAADGVILIAAYASHKASDQVRQAVERHGKPVALAHNAGLATFERVLVGELAPRLAGGKPAASAAHG